MELNDYYDDELLPGIHLLMPNINATAHHAMPAHPTITPA